VVDRFVEIRVRALGRESEPIDMIVRGLSAGTFQHETDHLHGTLFIDRVTDARALCTWSEFHERYEAAFVDRVRALVDRFGT
jgi:peptide deformylase